MREELEAEKAAMARIWKKREAQLTVPALDTVAALPAAEVLALVPKAAPN
jgi:hypothetical protein